MDAGKLVKALEDSDLIAYGGLLAVKSIVPENDELTPEEKADGELQMSRFADGMSKNRFGEAEMEEMLGPIASDDEGGNDEPSADEIRAMIARAKTMADEAGLDEVGLQIDLVGELQSLVDQVLPDR